jgi:hypothetical protein
MSYASRLRHSTHRHALPKRFQLSTFAPCIGQTMIWYIFALYTKRAGDNIREEEDNDELCSKRFQVDGVFL